MSTASTLERQMLSLINAERASHGLAPVQLELRLNDAAEDHSRWMLNTNQFSHTGVNGSAPWDRMGDAGFQFSGSWRATENIAWQSVRGAPGLSDDVQNLHDGLMNSPGHRANILDPNVTLVGIGIETGNFNGWNAIMVTQNFARTSATPQLDTGGASPAPVPPAPPAATPSETFVDAGTAGNEGDNWLTLKSGQFGRLDGAGGNDILTGQTGRDILIGGTGHDTLNGQAAADLLNGGTGKDTLDGGRGHDILKGGRGADTLNGGIGNDRLAGGNGIDQLTGGSGADEFVFTKGTNTVTDFEDVDVIALTKVTSITSYADLLSNHITQSGSNVVIDDGLGNVMILENTLLTDLDQGHFLF